MKIEVVEQAMKLYQKKFGGNLVEISILFVNVTETLLEAEQAAQQSAQADEVPRCTCKAGTGGHASWCELEKYWAVLRR